MGLFLTDEKCIKQRAYVNIPEWHEAGYLGQGLTIFHDDVNETHSECCVDIIQTILPAARVLSGRIGNHQKDNQVISCTVYCNETDERLPFEDFIEKYDVSQINNSTSGRANDNLETPIARYMGERIKQYNLLCTGAAGNSESKNSRYKGAFIMVGGVFFLGKTDRIMPSGPTWEWIDFSMFMGFQSGTSFAAPFLNGMAGLLRSKYGRQMTQQEIYRCLEDGAKYLNKAEEKAQSGRRIPVLPDVNAAR